MPTVSVIIPYYKGEKFLDAAIRSVLNQTFSDWELIVVDDGSPDNGVGIAEQHAREQPKVTVVRMPNGGVSCARNVGVTHARPGSEYLLFLDQDDELETSALDTMVAGLGAYPEAGAAYFSFTVIDDEGQQLEGPVSAKRCVPTATAPGWRMLPPDLAGTPLVALFTHHDAVPTVTLFRRHLFERTGGWDENFRHAFEDQDMLWQCAVLAPVVYLPVPVARKRDHLSNNVKQSLTPGFRQLANKWWQGKHLTPETRTRVRLAMAQEALVTARLIFHEAGQSFRSKDFSLSGKLVFRAARKLALHVVRILSASRGTQDIPRA